MSEEAASVIAGHSAADLFWKQESNYGGRKTVRSRMGNMENLSQDTKKGTRPQWRWPQAPRAYLYLALVGGFCLHCTNRQESCRTGAVEDAGMAGSEELSIFRARHRKQPQEKQLGVIFFLNFSSLVESSYCLSFAYLKFDYSAVHV